MKRLFTGLLTLLLCFQGRAVTPDPEAFRLLDLSRPGLEEVSASYHAGNIPAAADALLRYFKDRSPVNLPLASPDAPLTAQEQKWADEALEHRFFVHTGYQPSFFYGQDIDWTYWPVKDNELRWQLHRTKWWVPLGKAWRASGDDKYAREWVAEYLDWIQKNPLGNYDENAIGDLLTADNMYFAWRPLEVSDRLEHQLEQFLLLLPSRPFDGAFLTRFLVNYHRHCAHLSAHFAPSGNHRLFEAQRLLMATVFFPEMRESATWQQQCIEILGKEMDRQVYPDGIQYELDPHYHLECVKIFAKALSICEAAGRADVFPPAFKERLHLMIQAIYNYSFPDYCNPMFSDFHGQAQMPPLYRQWQKIFPEDKMIARLSGEGEEGQVPSYLSRAFSRGGYYCLRNGWDEESTVLVLKAGPPAFWHCQPDNGTFEYWRKGRNFLPDSGGYVYGGDAGILAQREWFRQTAVHNTITLDGRNLERTDSRLVSWSSDSTGTHLCVENPSYEGLMHRRSVFFRADGTVRIEDVASGEAAGVVALSYNLLPCEPEEDYLSHRVQTVFPDGNNVSICVLSPSYITMERLEGRISYTYKHYQERPRYRFSTYKKAGETIRFVTLIDPLP